MENAMFLPDTAENPYASLPKYGDEEGTMVFDAEQDIASVHTEESLTGSTQPLHVRDRHFKTKPRSSRDSSLRGYHITRSINVPETFSEEIRPPSLFAPDVPPAPSEMHGPTKYGERLVSSASVFSASRQGAGVTSNVPPSQMTQQGATARQFVVPVQTPHPPQPVYVTQASPTPLAGYKVPASIATSLAGRDTTRAVFGTNTKVNGKVSSKANARCWRGFLFLAVFLVVVLVFGSAVAAVVLTQV